MKVITNPTGSIKCLCADSLQEFLNLDWRLSSSEKFGDKVLYHFEYQYTDYLVIYLGLARSFYFNLLSCRSSPEIPVISFGVRYYLNPSFSREIGLRYFSDVDKMPQILHDRDAEWIYNRLCSRFNG